MPHVGSFSSRPHAEMAAGMLGAHGIRAVVAGDDAGGIAPHVTFISGGGYALSVAAVDVEEAQALLAGTGTLAGRAEDHGELLTVPDAATTGSTRRALVLRLVLRTALAAFLAVVVVQAIV